MFTEPRFDQFIYLVGQTNGQSVHVSSINKVEGQIVCLAQSNRGFYGWLADSNFVLAIRRLVKTGVLSKLRLGQAVDCSHEIEPVAYLFHRSLIFLMFHFEAIITQSTIDVTFCDNY